MRFTFIIVIIYFFFSISVPSNTNTISYSIQHHARVGFQLDICQKENAHSRAFSSIGCSNWLFTIAAGVEHRELLNGVGFHCFMFCSFRGLCRRSTMPELNALDKLSSLVNVMKKISIDWRIWHTHTHTSHSTIYFLLLTFIGCIPYLGPVFYSYLLLILAFFYYYGELLRTANLNVRVLLYCCLKISSVCAYWQGYFNQTHTDCASNTWWRVRW